MNGRVMRVLAEKQFGFIKGEDGTEYFFHKQDLNGFFEDLVTDMDDETKRPIMVKFDAVSSSKGPRAGSVTRMDSGV